eukprot:GAHX01000366.1.p1 GENE.GAHX01000366.1~~GAHX01000366.1.p1  ORF type:complete len:249 (-),score=58.14 GAHX01000366.1:40-786(-)
MEAAPTKDVEQVKVKETDKKPETDKRGPRKFQGPNLERWRPKTTLGQLVKTGKITSMDQVFGSSMRIKESEIISKLLPSLGEEVIGMKSVQSMSSSGQRNKYKAVTVVGDRNGYIGIGHVSAKEAPDAIRSAFTKAKLRIRPVRLGFYGKAVGEPHTVRVKASGKCGSVHVRLIPAARGTGIRASPLAKKIIELAGVKDCYTKSKGQTGTKENTVKALLKALEASSNFMVEEDWNKEKQEKVSMKSKY